jgi:branched-chain amino acid transport system substrate-binding protein
MAGDRAIEIPLSLIFDDAINGTHDPERGAANMTILVEDPSVVAVIGPLTSNVARAEIPISNAAGIAQCSPVATGRGLTTGPAAAALRGSPNNFVRLATADNVQGTIAGEYLFEALGEPRAYVIDDASGSGNAIADAVEARFESLGGKVTGHDSAEPGSESYPDLLNAARTGKPGAIVFGGAARSEAVAVLLAAAEVGLGDLPFIFVGADGASDGSTALPRSFLNIAGDAAAPAHTVLSDIKVIPDWAAFNRRYRAAYGSDANAGAAQGYACAQVLLDAIVRAARDDPTANRKEVREAVRVALTDTTRTYSTVLGDISFDANGDTDQEIAAMWAFSDTKGDWSFEAEVPFDVP